LFPLKGASQKNIAVIIRGLVDSREGFSYAGRAFMLAVKAGFWDKDH
jgi:hypothetical protein